MLLFGICYSGRQYNGDAVTAAGAGAVVRWRWRLRRHWHRVGHVEDIPFWVVLLLVSTGKHGSAEKER